MSGALRETIDAGLAALAARDPARAAQLLREAAQATPSAEMPWIALANAEMGLGQNDAAEAALDQQLELTPREIGALLLKALLRERAGDPRAASSFYQTALNQAAVSGDVPPQLAALEAHARSYVGSANAEFEAHLRAQLGTDISPALAEALDLLTGKRQLYLQQPTVFYYPGLAQRRFYDPDDFPWLAPMLALLPQMQQELAAVLASETGGFTPYVSALSTARRQTIRCLIARPGGRFTSGVTANKWRRMRRAAPRRWRRSLMHRCRKFPDARPMPIGHGCCPARRSRRTPECSTRG